MSRPGSASCLKALESPIRQIAENAGNEGSIVVGKISDNKSQTYGFNAQTEEYVDMIEAGIVDPAKVVRTALQDAASVAGLLITTEAMIGDKPKKEAARDADGRRRWRHGRHGLLKSRAHPTFAGQAGKGGRKAALFVCLRPASVPSRRERRRNCIRRRPI